MRKEIVVVILAGAALWGQSGVREYGRSMTRSRQGIVATSQILASQAGAEMLGRGGAAADAAIAANPVLGVVEPMMDGIGGDLFALYWDARSGRLFGLNASGWSPGRMTREFMLGQGLKSMPGTGIHSVTVPGCVAGWAEAHQKFGRLPWKELFGPAIHYAREGFPVSERIAAGWNDAGSLPRLSSKEAAPEVFLPGGKAPVEGQLFRNAGLAQALTLIAEQGAAAFYRGPIAAAIVANARSLGGTMESDDLAGFSPEWVEPVSTTYRGWRVSQLPPNGQGISVLEMLNLMETAPIGQWAAMSAEALHFKIESMRIAYADLRHYVSDPRFVKIPVAGMLDKSYAGKRAAAIDPQKANCQAAPGDFPGSGNTTYLAAVDSQGNIASWIQSVAGMWGSYVAVPGYGFHLQNRGSSFRLDPAHANTLAPRKRPFHTIIPGFLEKDSLRIGFGIMGGAVQPLAHAQFVSNVVDHGMNLQAALDAPRFIEGRSTRGVKPTGCELGLENRVPPEVRAALETKGHRIGLMGAFNLIYTGAGQAVMHDSATGLNAGASDPRADGAAVPGRPQ